MFVIFFILAAIGLPFLSPHVQKSLELKRVIMVVIFVHQVTSFLQVALRGLPTMKMDPLRFHFTALRGVGMRDTPYIHFLHEVYQVFGGSHLLGCEVSNIFFGIALIVQIEILYFLGVKKHAPKLILLFGLLPSCILNTSVTLREAAQMAFFLILVLLLLKIGRSGPTISSLLLLPVAWSLVNLHQGFAAALALLLPLTFAWSARSRPIVMSILIIAGLSGSYLVKDKLMDSLTSKSQALEQITSGNVEYIERYATHVPESRTSFGVSLDLSSPVAFLTTGPHLLTYYLFSPLPWQVRGLLDLYGMGESFLRMLLMFLGFFALKNSKGTLHQDVILLIILFIGMEAVWAAGTANWGTAFRHRLVAWGLLVALAGVGLNTFTGDSSEQQSTTDKSTRKSPRSSIRARRRALRDRRAKRQASQEQGD